MSSNDPGYSEIENRVPRYLREMFPDIRVLESDIAAGAVTAKVVLAALDHIHNKGAPSRLDELAAVAAVVAACGTEAVQSHTLRVIRDIAEVADEMGVREMSNLLEAFRRNLLYEIQ